MGRLLNYLLVPLYTRVFTPDQYGVVTEMYAYVAFLVVILTYGMETALFRFSSESNNKKIIFSTALITLFCTTISFVFLAFVFSIPVANWLGYPNHTEYVIWFAIIVGMDAMIAIPMAKLREMNKAKLFTSINLINIFVNIGLNLFFLVYCNSQYQQYGKDSNWLVNTFYNPEVGVGYVFISNLIASAVKAGLLIPSMLHTPLKYDTVLFKKMILYALPLLLVGLAGIINETLDRILIKRLLIDQLGEKNTMAQLGIYGACYKISIIISIFIQAFRYAAEPFFFSMHKKENAKKVYSEVMNYFVITCSAIFLGIMVYIDYVMLFVGKDFRQGVKVVPILLMANLCLGIYFNLSIWYKLTGKTRYGAYIAITGAVITIVLNFICIPKFSYFGSACTTLICYFTMAAISYLYSQKYYPVNYNLKKLFGYPLLVLFLYNLSILISSAHQPYKLYINTLILLAFIGFVILIEKPKAIKTI